MLIVPDHQLAAAALAHWPSVYQARLMTTIALVESGGDLHALYYNKVGLFADTVDRGPWGINEVAIVEVLGAPVDPREFGTLAGSARMAKAIWDWRLARAVGSLHLPYGSALIYAYSGWATYKYRNDPAPQYANLRRAWPVMFARAGAALAA